MISKKSLLSTKKMIIIAIIIITVVFSENVFSQKKEWQSEYPSIQKQLTKLPVKGPYFPIDERIIEDRWMVKRFVVPLQRYANNPIIRKDTPLEELGRGPEAYGTILFDKQDDLFKMWYLISDSNAYNNKLPYSYNVCYAESKDGLHWQKPNLGLFTNRGMISPDNNVISLGREKIA